MQPSLRTGKGHRDQMSNTVIKETVWRASRRKLQCRSHRFNPWVGNIPWRRKWQPTPVFLLVKSHGQRSLVGHSPGIPKESDMTARACVRHTHTHTHTHTLI